MPTLPHFFNLLDGTPTLSFVPSPATTFANFYYNNTWLLFLQSAEHVTKKMCATLDKPLLKEKTGRPPSEKGSRHILFSLDLNATAATTI